MADHKNHVLAVPDANGVWSCTTCSQGFVAVADDHPAQALDQVAGVMEAVLWGVLERAVEKYGKEVVPEAAHQCEVDGHAFDGSGTCTHCGAGQFLGGRK